MQWGSPARLFHAIVLAGAALGASSCESKQLSAKKDAAVDQETALVDAGRDAPSSGSTDGPGLVLGDASTDAPRDASTDARDASCDLLCQHPVGSCQCIIIIL